MLATGSALWYFACATGIVSLVLLTASVVLGIMTSVRWTSRSMPRFVVEYTHRNVTLLVMVFIVLHVSTIVLDGFAPIGWIAAVVPLASPYRPIWLGLGALAFDLLLAVAITSWLRHRVGYPIWRAVHWAAYGSWAVAVFHGFGAGSDARQTWAIAVQVACVAAVMLAVWWRVGFRWEEHTRVRIAALVATIAFPMLLALFLWVGPLAPHWATRAGTPPVQRVGTVTSPASGSGTR